MRSHVWALSAVFAAACSSHTSELRPPDTEVADGGHAPDGAPNGDRDAEAPDATPSLTERADRFCFDQVRIATERDAECMGGTPEEWAHTYGPPLGCTVTDLLGVSAGRIVFDAASAGACLSAWANVPCEILFSRRRGGVPDPLADCLRVLQGTLPDGANCASSWECAAGTCDLWTDEPGNCSKTCIRWWLPTGAPCTDTSSTPVPQCRDGYCSPATHRCTDLPRLGESCDLGSRKIWCAGPSFCNPDRGRCERLLSTGSTCTWTGGVQEPCESIDALCDGYPTPRCQQLKRVGESCAPGEGCIYPWGTCARSSSTSAGRCVLHPTTGEPCTGDRLGDLFCVRGKCNAQGGQPGICVGKDGADCVADAQCGEERLRCVEGTCQSSEWACW